PPSSGPTGRRTGRSSPCAGSSRRKTGYGRVAPPGGSPWRRSRESGRVRPPSPGSRRSRPPWRYHLTSTDLSFATVLQVGDGGSDHMFSLPQETDRLGAGGDVCTQPRGGAQHGGDETGIVHLRVPILDRAGQCVAF